MLSMCVNILTIDNEEGEIMKLVDVVGSPPASSSIHILMLSITLSVRVAGSLGSSVDPASNTWCCEDWKEALDQPRGQTGALQSPGNLHHG